MAHRSPTRLKSKTRVAEEEAAYEDCLRERGLSVPSDNKEFEALLAAGCALSRYNPDVERPLECPPGQQSGTRSVLDNGGWLRHQRQSANGG